MWRHKNKKNRLEIQQTGRLTKVQREFYGPSMHTHIFIDRDKTPWGPQTRNKIREVLQEYQDGTEPWVYKQAIQR